MNITLKTVAPGAIAYSTCGNWEYLPDNSLKITVPDHGSEISAFLVALHELVEAVVCRAHNVKEADVTKWDIDHPELDEPGDHPDAPYHSEHTLATAIEEAVCEQLGINWDRHNKWVESAANEVDRKHAEANTPAITVDGPRHWATLHLFALLHDEQMNGRNADTWVKAWVRSLPMANCPCKDHLDQYLKDYPPDWSDLFGWSVELHNSVNARLGKQTLNVEDAKILWTTRSL